MSGQLDFAMNNDEKVALLEELHRPLEGKKHYRHH
jgi:hypothetical protein